MIEYIDNIVKRKKKEADRCLLFSIAKQDYYA